MTIWIWALLILVLPILGMTSSRRGVRRTEEDGSSPGFEPVRDSNGSAWAGTSFTTTGRPALDGATILVVDDDAEIRGLLDTLLRRRGMKVLTASDGLEGLTLFERHMERIQVILLDLTMPGMNGLEVSKAIRALRPDVPIIISSGVVEEVTFEHSQRPRSVALLQKPYNTEILYAAIEAAVAAGG